MKYLLQFGIVAAVSFVGEIMKSLIPLSVPASIYGLVVMLVLLLTGLVKLDAVEDCADFLVAIMPIMFVPPIVGLIDSYSQISGILWELVIITVVTTFVVMGVTGYAAQLLIKLTQKKKDEEC